MSLAVIRGSRAGPLDQYSMQCMVLLALILLVFVWVVFQDSNPYISNVADLGYVPDSVEYVLLAKAMSTGRLTLDINGVAWPIRYPPFLSFIIAPLYYLFPDPVRVASIAPVLIGISTIVAGFWTIWRFSGSWAAAVIFAGFLATSPLLIVTSWAVLSEPATMCVAFILALFVLREMETPHRGNRIAIGAAAGALVLLKIQSVFLLAACVVAALPYLRTFSLRLFIEVTAAFIATTMFLLFYNAALFGNPFKTGYDWQVGYSFFSLSAFPKNLEFMERLFRGLKISNLSHTWPGMPAGIFVFATLGVVKIGRLFGWRPVFAIACLLLLPSVPLLFYEFVDLRFHLALVVGIYGLAAYWLGTVMFPWVARFMPRQLAIGLTLLAVLIWPIFGKSSPLAFVSGSHQYKVSDKYLLFQALRGSVHRDGRPAAFLSAIYLPLAAEWAGGSVKVFPLLSRPCFGPCETWTRTTFSYNIEELKQSRAVYVSDAELQPEKFRVFCLELEKQYRLREIPVAGRFRLFEVLQANAPGPTNVCPAAIP